jgi:hypothetical protein
MGRGADRPFPHPAQHESGCRAPVEWQRTIHEALSACKQPTPNTPIMSSTKASARRHGASPTHKATVLAALGLALIPPLLVVLDRWFGFRLQTGLLNRLWHDVPFLRDSPWPPYFLFVAACALACMLIVLSLGAVTEQTAPRSILILATGEPGSRPRPLGLALVGLALLAGFSIAILESRKGIVPGSLFFPCCILYLLGWAVATTDTAEFSRRIREDLGLLLGQLLGIIVVSYSLFIYYSASEISGGAIVLSVPTAFLLYWNRQRVTAGYWCTLLALVVFSIGLNQWYYAFVGDEYAFYNAARSIALEHNWRLILDSLTNGSWIYAHPYFVTWFQSISMRLFDALNFGWRFSSIAASAFAVLAFHYFLRTFLPTWLAGTTAFLIAASHYLMSFSRIGYDNTQALLAIGCAMAGSAYAVRKGGLAAFAVCGLTWAFCFYTYAGALYILPVALLLLLLYRPPWTGAAAPAWMALAATLMFLILPLLFQPVYWSTKLSGTLLSLGAPTDLTAPALRVLTQFAYAFFSFLYMPSESHFV